MSRSGLVSYVREQDTLRGTEKSVLSRMCWPIKGLVSGSWRRLGNKDI